MNDLISRKAAIDAVDAIGHIATMPDGDKCIRRSAVKYTLSMLPTAQPERKVGKWTEDNACEFCGFKPWYERDIHTLSYCPNCGADMRGETT